MNLLMLASSLYLGVAAANWIDHDPSFAVVCFAVGLMACTLVHP